MKYYYIILFILIILAIIKYFTNRNIVPYEERLNQLKNNIKNNTKISTNNGHIFGLKKLTSKKIDLSKFCKLIKIDYDNNIITVEGNIPISNVIDYLIKCDRCLYVMPEMYHLTVAGLISGVGGGSSSYKYGYFHDNIVSMDIINSQGDVITCSKTENEDLFKSIPNSLGTLGYILKADIKIRKCDPYVITTNIKYDNSEAFFRELQNYTKDDNIDFIDGVIFSKDLYIIVIGKFSKKLPKQESNFYKNIYWESIMTDSNHYFKLKDYIYRWDPDMYFSSMSTPIWSRNKVLRSLVPKILRKSTIMKKIAPILNLTIKEIPLMNDILIPYKRAEKFYKWFQKNIGLYPIYICPAKTISNSTLWPSGFSCDFGIGYGVNLSKDTKSLVKKLEKVMYRLKGKKLLYKNFNLDENKFWKIYKNKDKYKKLKDKHDPNYKFSSLFDKVSIT